MEPTIIFENAEYLVLDKPAGLMMHGDGRSTEATLADWLVSHKKVDGDVGEPWTDQKGVRIPRPGIVHRLDRDTSGVVVVAKTQEVYEYLKEQFQTRNMKKEYRALVLGIIREKSGVIDRPIGKSAADFRKKSAQRGAKGVMRDAVTAYETLKRVLIDGHECTLVALFPKTGRTHQLRVHLKAINHPILGDTLYGSVAGSWWTHGLALHAYELSFTDPHGVAVTYTAPLPRFLALSL